MATKKKTKAPAKKAPSKGESTSKTYRTAAKKSVKKAAKPKPAPKKKAEAKAADVKKTATHSKPKSTKKVTEKKTTASKAKNATATKTAKASTKKAAASNGSKSDFVYKPNPSLLDTPETAYTPGRRYSDVDLQEFKEIIQQKLGAARKEVSYLQGLITRKGEYGTDDTESKFMGVEDGSGTMEREQLSQLASRQIQYIDHLEKALMRIENKTYGICRVTGKLIDKKRLRAVPHATLSIAAKQSRKK